MWTTVYLPEASDEESKLPPRERLALANAIEKLELLGDRLGYPHSSAVRSADNLRELRPRAGRSPHRALYRIVGEYVVIAAVGSRGRAGAVLPAPAPRDGQQEGTERRERRHRS